ncbi:phthiotriol/phenolphthiotriol dimycocerosates methyltransferase [Mycobacterium syngnathidarum]
MVWKLSAKFIYPLQTRRLEGDDVVFLNVGYDEESAMEVPLEDADEPNRASIQLYHRLAMQTDINGKRVLEVGCGHGGGASYLSRYLRPASYTAMDLNPEGIAFCRRRHRIPNLSFVQGDAQHLPFPDASFDIVINVESSHCYPDFPGFLLEVARALAPNGRFLYTDVRNRRHTAEWDVQLAAAPLEMLSQSEINLEVVRGLDRLWSAPETHRRFNRSVPAPMRAVAKSAAGAPGYGLYRALSRGDISYRMYSFAAVS